MQGFAIAIYKYIYIYTYIFLPPYIYIPMFTWIITHTPKILTIDEWVFRVENLFDEKLVIGQSIAHDGACMTVKELSDESYTFFAMDESFQKTNFGSKQVWDLFNCELAMKVDQRLDGHVVSGHIDAKGLVSGRETADDGSKKLTISFDHVFDSLIIPKGSVTINGVSLTVVDIWEGTLSVRLIPQTLAHTNLSKLIPGHEINLEFDMLAKYVTKFGRK